VLKFKYIPFILFCCLGLFACNNQRGYSHTSVAFNDEDRAVVNVVEKSVLGKLEVMREVVRGIIDSPKPLHSCNYFVEKVIDRDLSKDGEGHYPVHYLVQCSTFVDDGASFWFSWKVSDSDVTAFEWHVESTD
jgi:hypothetical protein